MIDKTLWIYIATEKDLLTINAMGGMGGVMPDKIMKFLDLQCQYDSSSFLLDYVFLKYTPEEIAKERDLLNKKVGGTTLYQDFTQTTIEVLQKTYFAIGDIIDKTADKNFFVIVLADIKKGLKITFVIHRLDIEQFLLNILPSDEFYKRMVLKTDGGKDIINDKYGLHIEYQDISLPDFLREQIANNARSKLSEMEKFKPDEIRALDSLDDIILKSVYDVTIKYEFDDYVLVEVQDLISNKKLSLSKLKLINRYRTEQPAASSLEEYNF